MQTRTRLLLAALATCSLAGMARAQVDDDGVPWWRRQEAATKAARLDRLSRAGKVQHPTARAYDSYDATYYELHLDLDPAATRLTGNVAMQARVVSGPLSSATLDLDSAMYVDSVRVGGATAGYAHVGDELVVTLDRAYVAGDSFRVEVGYSGTPNRADRAFGFDTRDGAPLIWTLSEPYGARTWWPCKDTPEDKADSVAVDLTVPSNLIAVSEGTLLDTLTAAPGKTTWRWRERYPIASYLVSVAAHPYTVLSTTYTPAAGGTMPVTAWFYPDQTIWAAPILALTPRILQCYSGLFGEYPFTREKYGYAQFPWGGGMEHQTVTSIGGWSEHLAVHETAHQWFGDAVTCRSFSHVWLNEGFATYAEALWDESKAGLAAYQANIWDNRYYGPGTIYVPPAEAGRFGRIFDGYLSYGKPSFVLHTLRSILGDSTFFAVLRAYRADPRFAYGTAATEDFQSVAEAVSGRSLARFFGTWIYRPYFPSYLVDYSTAPDGGGWRLTLSLEQLQTQALYDLPLHVRVTTTAGTEEHLVRDSLAVQSFDLHVGAEPTAVQIDPDNWVLHTSEQAVKAPALDHGVLVVNGASWSIPGSTITSAYTDSVFGGRFPFAFWDLFDTPPGGYVPELPAPIGHGAIPPQVLGQYSSVVWVGNAYQGDLELWGNAAIVSYLRQGGNVLLLGRRGQEFLTPSRSSYLGLRWVESPLSTVGAATPDRAGIVPMATTGTQSQVAVFETGFDQPETILLCSDTQTFAKPRGLGAWRHPRTSSNPRRGNFAFLGGSPHLWEHAALRTNVHAILHDLFREPRPGDPEPERVPLATRLYPAVPNPFNPPVELRFDVARSGRVSLGVYDLRGRLVRVLVDAVLQPSAGRASWDGLDAGGREAASGVYVVRLRAGDAVRSEKATLVR